MTGTTTAVDVLTCFATWQRARCYTTNTIDRSRYCLRAFERHAQVALLEATSNDIERWINRPELAPNTRRCYLAILQSFYRWAVRNSIVDTDPTVPIDPIRARRTLPRPISDRDLAVALNHADPRMSAWLHLAALQGFRCQEIAGLLREDIMEDRALLLVSAGKGGHERVVPLHPVTWEALVAFGLPRSGPVFRRYGCEALQPWTVSRTTAVYLRGIGVDATLHQLRHWYATRLYQQERDLLLVRDLMGHATAKTTEVYTQVARGRSHLAVARLTLPV